MSALSPSNKKGYVEWITSARKPETRADRVTKAIERLERGELLHFDETSV